KGAPTLREELGDLLLQVLMHCAIAQEDDGGFDIGDVADVARAKMIHRHPHVFGDVAVDGAAEVVVNWEKLKRSENHPRLSLLDGVPHALPALAFAQGVQKRPARVGFDETPSVQSALERVHDARGDGGGAPPDPLVKRRGSPHPIGAFRRATANDPAHVSARNPSSSAVQPPTAAQHAVSGSESLRPSAASSHSAFTARRRRGATSTRRWPRCNSRTAHCSSKYPTVSERSSRRRPRPGSRRKRANSDTSCQERRFSF